MRKDPDVQTLSEEIFQDLGNFLYILPRFSPIIELLAAVISNICGNIHKINQTCGNLPETFWVDKFQAYLIVIVFS